MRIRLVHTLSLWLLAVVGVSVAAMGLVSAWNLGQGFNDYLRARDVERMEQFAQLIAERLESIGGTAADAAIDMPELLRELERREGRGVSQTDMHPMPGGPGPGTDRPPPPRPSPPDAFGNRVALYAVDGRRWAGPPLDDAGGELIERPVRVNDRVVGLLRMRAATPIPDENDARFLRSQYLGIVGVSISLILFAIAIARWLSLQWVRPLQAVQRATARIAQGELDVRLPTKRNDEIGDLVRNINQMAESLQRIEAARRRWIADMSHELRTPLAGLRGEIESMVDGVRPMSLEAMTSLRDDVMQLGRLVDDLHLLAMADLQSLPCHFSEVDAVELLQNCMKKFEPRAQSAGLSLSWAQPPPAAIPARWDAQRMEQLLGNLMTNSLRYTDAPGRITVSIAAQNGSAYLTLEDTAPGVAAADLPHLFEPLFRADATRSRQSGGSGLGLAISEAIVRSHRGTLSADASVLGGLRIQMVLPLDAEA